MGGIPLSSGHTVSRKSRVEAMPVSLFACAACTRGMAAGPAPGATRCPSAQHARDQPLHQGARDPRSERQREEHGEPDQRPDVERPLAGAGDPRFEGEEAAQARRVLRARCAPGERRAIAARTASSSASFAARIARCTPRTGSGTVNAPTAPTIAIVRRVTGIVSSSLAITTIIDAASANTRALRKPIRASGARPRRSRRSMRATRSDSCDTRRELPITTSMSRIESVQTVTSRMKRQERSSSAEWPGGSIAFTSEWTAMPARSAASSDGSIARTGASASRSGRMLRTIQLPHAKT